MGFNLTGENMNIKKLVKKPKKLSMVNFQLEEEDYIKFKAKLKKAKVRKADFFRACIADFMQ